MKKLTTIILCVLLSLSLISCSNSSASDDTNEISKSNNNEKSDTAKDDALQKIKEKGELIVATSPDYPPYEFKIMEDGKEKIVGFDIAIAEEIAKDLGVSLRILEQNFDGLLVGLNAGNSDMVMAGMSPNSERKKAMDFSKIYYEAEQGILIKAENKDNIKGMADLAEKKVGVQKGSIQEALAKEKLPDSSNIVSLIKLPNLVLELKSGNIDAVIMEIPVAKGYLNNHSDLAITPEVTKDETGGSAIAIKKGSESLVDAINSTLDRLKEEGLIDKFVQEANEIVDNM